jgi:hypothetical protein
MSIRKKLTDAAVSGFGMAVGREVFERAKKELLGEDEGQGEAAAPPDPKEQARLAKEAARRAKEEEKRAAAEAAEKRKAAKKLEKDVDRELAELKKRLGK